MFDDRYSGLLLDQNPPAGVEDDVRHDEDLRDDAHGIDAPPPPDAPAIEPAPRPRPRRGHRALMVAVVVACLLGATGGGWLAGRTASDGVTTSSAPISRASLTFSSAAMDVAAVVAKVEPSVVSIETDIVQYRGPFSSTGTAAGTGIVLDAQGHIVTNAHVVDGATAIRVKLNGESQWRTARLVASDTAADVAVLQVSNTTGLVAAGFGSAATLEVGDDVVAIGNALALDGGPTVTRGIISALDRSITTDSGSLSGLVQTDAAISSGNSGGPLVDAQGHVVGMNTAVAVSSGGVNAANVGFAISINRVLSVARNLIANGAA